MNRQDLTLPENFTKFLGTFWSEIFDDGLFAGAIGNYSSQALAQIYKDLVVSVNSCSVDSVPVYRRESVYPLVVSKRDIEDNTSVPTYGSGLLYGKQSVSSPSLGEVVVFGKTYKEKDLYFVELPEELQLTDSQSLIAMERLYGASVLWVNGIDFSIKGKRIIFKQNPFSLAAFPRRIMRKDGTDDVETVLWLCEVDFDKNDIFRNFGSIFSKIKTSSEDYKNVCRNFLSLISTGASIDRVDALLSSAAASPLIKQDGETIIDIIDSPEGVFVETDKNLYKIPSHQVLKSSVVVGATLGKNHALTSVVDVINPKTRPDWWRSLVSIPAADMLADDDIQLLSFPNTTSSVTFKSLGEGIVARFDVTGDKSSVDKFWNNLDKQVQEQGVKMTDFLSSTVNPAQFFAENVANSIILPIIIDVEQVDNVPFLFSSVSSSINQLRSVFPVYAFVCIFLKIETSDTYIISGDENGQGALAADAFAGNHRSPGIQSDSLNCGEKEFATESILVKYRSKCSL